MKQVLIVQSGPATIKSLAEEIENIGIKKLRGLNYQINTMFSRTDIPGQRELYQAFANWHVSHGLFFWVNKNDRPKLQFGSNALLNKLVTVDIINTQNNYDIFQAVKRSMKPVDYYAEASRCYMALTELFVTTLQRFFVCLAFVPEPFFSMVADAYHGYGMSLPTSKPLCVWHYIWDENKSTDPGDYAGDFADARYYG